jgi:CRISPR system Cascade subunit CasD
MTRHLILNLAAPLLSFGGATIDSYGVTRDFPAASMLTGLIANALGWCRSDRKAHQNLQDRLIFAARLDHKADNPGSRLQDVQNARLYQKDQGWTTSGEPQGRKVTDSYNAVDQQTPLLGKYLLQRRYRDYHADACVNIAMRLEKADMFPALEDIAEALGRPARPLFLGRKACLPSRPVLPPEADRWIEAASVYEALCLYPTEIRVERCRAQWPVAEGPGSQGYRQIALCDERNWLTGMHGGSRQIVEGMIVVAGENRIS